MLKPPRKSPAGIAARQIAQLRLQNARLRADADSYRKQQKAGQRAATTKPLVLAQAFEATDPRRSPKIGTKVMQPLGPPLTLGKSMGAAIAAELKAMAIEARSLVRSLISQPDVQSAMDSVTDDAQHRMNALQAKWEQRFTSLAERWTQRMLSGVLEQSTAQLNLGLKDVAERIQIQTTLQSQRLRAVVEASSKASVGLITRIPERFLGAVQTAVMSAITTGTGLEQLVPYLTKKYKGDARHAHLVALDQIRKVSESVNATRLQSLGVEEYVWMHTGGERYPRKLHQSYSGQTFRYDDPPVIDEKTGVRGKPGDIYNCRCRMRPILNFMRMREEA